MILMQGKSPFQFLIKKISVRVVFIFAVLAVLFLVAKVILQIPLDSNFLYIIINSYLYLLFWFSLCIFVIFLRKSSNANAIILLSSWLLLVVFIPVLINNYIVNKYPVGEAFTMTIKQRDEYHKRWDTDKKETMDKFYAHYPQFAKYGIKEQGFSWLWYYAMQQMGDDQSKNEREAMYLKIAQREALSKQIARYFPPLQVQLSMNEIAKTGLTNHIEFLKATTNFHEDLRLFFYPKIFENESTDSIDWENHESDFFKEPSTYKLLNNIIFTMILTVLLLSFGLYKRVFFKVK